jgi:hypothetical protein
MHALVRSVAAAILVIALGVPWQAPAQSQTAPSGTIVRVASLSTSPFGWNGTWLQFGPPLDALRERLAGYSPGIIPQDRGLGLTGPGPLYGLAAEIVVRPDGKLVLSSGGQSFVLGTRTGSSFGDDPKMAAFVAEPGDTTSLVIEHDTAWPVHETNFMTGNSPILRRHVYYRLNWVKASADRLAMLWVGEQGYCKFDSWGAPGGLLTRVEISRASGAKP